MLLRSWLLPVKTSSNIFFYVIDGSVNIKCDVMLDTLVYSKTVQTVLCGNCALEITRYIQALNPPDD